MSYREYLTYQRLYQAQYRLTPKGKYQEHKGSAGTRGIPFLLTFEEWWGIWQASGKWEQRGRLRNQYVMARFGDCGAYERSNVRICLAGENTDEMRRGLPPHRARTLQERRTVDREAKQRKRQGRMLLDPAKSEKAMGRRMVVRNGRRCWSYPEDKDYPS